MEPFSQGCERGITHQLAQSGHVQTLGAGPDVPVGVEPDLLERIPDLVADELGELADRVFLPCPDVHHFPVHPLRELQHQPDEIIDEDELPPLMAVAPEHYRLAIETRPQDLADEIEDEVHLPAVRMVAGPVESGWHQGQGAEAVLLPE